MRKGEEGMWNIVAWSVLFVLAVFIGIRSGKEQRIGIVKGLLLALPFVIVAVFLGRVFPKTESIVAVSAIFLYCIANEYLVK